MRTRKFRRREAKRKWKDLKKKMNFTEFWRKNYIKRKENLYDKRGNRAYRRRAKQSN